MVITTNKIMKREARIKFKRVGRLTGVYLYDEEIFLMEQLLIHQSMQSASVHEIYRSLSMLSDSGKVRTTNAISNRIAVLIRSGILVHRKEKVGTGNVFYYHYRLGKRGVESLVELNLLTKSEAERIYGYLTRLQIPSTHTKASSLLANRIYLSFIDFDWFNDLEHQRGISYSEFSAKDSIVPDWVLSRGNIIVCLETDTGSERQNIMNPKFMGYIEKSKELLIEAKEVVVIFSVVDSSLAGDRPNNRDKRIASLKDLLPPLTDWPSNLHFYVVSAERTPPLVERLLSFAEPSSPFERFTYAEDWVRQASRVLGNSFAIDTLENDAVFLPNRNRDMDCDLVLSVTEGGGTKNLYGVTYGEEGSVVTYQLARANAKRVMDVNEQQRNNSLKQLIIYDNKIRMDKDVFGYVFESDVLLTDSMTWMEAMSINAAAPEVLQVASPYTRERRPFNE